MGWGGVGEGRDEREGSDSKNYIFDPILIVIRCNNHFIVMSTGNREPFYIRQFVSIFENHTGEVMVYTTSVYLASYMTI